MRAFVSTGAVDMYGQKLLCYFAHCQGQPRVRSYNRKMFPHFDNCMSIGIPLNLSWIFFFLFFLTLFVVLQVTLMTTLSAVPCLKGPLPHYGFVQHPVALPPPSLLAVEQQELVKSAPVHLWGLSRHQARLLFSLHCDLVSFLQYRPPSTLFWKAREVCVLVSTLMILEVSVVK